MARADVGEWPSGKAPDSGSGDRRFESFLPSHPPPVSIWTPCWRRGEIRGRHLPLGHRSPGARRADLQDRDPVS